MTEFQKQIAVIAQELGERASMPMPPLLQVGLSGEGFKLRSWYMNEAVDEHWLEFGHGTCCGLIGCDRHKLRLILMAVINTAPGNGDFSKLLEALERVTRPMEVELAVGPFWNDGLKKHLLAKRGFKDDGEFVVKAWA